MVWSVDGLHRVTINIDMNVAAVVVVGRLAADATVIDRLIHHRVRVVAMSVYDVVNSVWQSIHCHHTILFSHLSVLCSSFSSHLSSCFAITPSTGAAIAWAARWSRWAAVASSAHSYCVLIHFKSLVNACRLEVFAWVAVNWPVC